MKPLRWDPYLLWSSEDVSRFLSDYCADEERQFLLVLGKGFDPRMNDGATIVAATCKNVEALVLDLLDPEFPGTPDQASLASSNMTRLRTLLGSEKIREESITVAKRDGGTRHRIGSRVAGAMFSEISKFGTYTDIIFDVSALPRGIYLSAIAALISGVRESRERGETSPNLFVFVSELPDLDKDIRDASLEEKAEFIHGFSGGVGLVANSGSSVVWLPILGEGQREQLIKIEELVGPAERCPVLPMPALNPRRGDDLVLQYRALLFDNWRIEPAHVLYVDERNPFEAYRQLCTAIWRYREAFELIGGCSPVISALASKLLSIGALLAACEMKDAGIPVGIAHVEAVQYEFSNTSAQTFQAVPFLMMLEGDLHDAV